MKVKSNIVYEILSILKSEKILEIGSGYGNNTKDILKYCNQNNTEFIGVDPNPKFDLESFKNNYNQDFEFIYDYSLNVLERFDGFDTIFLDGDPNWFTVFNELKALEKFDKKPVIFLCNSTYPNKRKDSYYYPENIPSEFKHESTDNMIITFENNNQIQQISLDDCKENAIYENTPKNGVLTALEDYVKDCSYDISFNYLQNGMILIYENQKEQEDKIKLVIEKYALDDNSIAFYDKISLNAFLEEYICQIQEKNMDLENKLIDFDNVKKDCDLYKNDISEFRNTINLLNSEKITLNDTISKHENTISEYENTVDSKNQEIEKLENHYEDLIKEKNEEVTAIKEECESFKNEVINHEDTIHNLESENLKYVNKCSDLNQEIIELKNNIVLNSNLENIVEKQKTVINEKQKELKEKESKINNQEKTISHVLNHSSLKNGIMSYYHIVTKSSSSQISKNITLYKKLKKNSYFDIGFYLNNYNLPDWGKDYPLIHFICVGFDENKLPSKNWEKMSKDELINKLG